MKKGLSATARRHGWIGCNFNLIRIPAEARIGVVITRSSGRQSAPSSIGGIPESRSRLTSAATIIIPPEEVREKFKRVKPLKEIGVNQRGWTLDVLNIVRRICEVGTAGPAVRAPSGRNVPAALPPVTPRRGVPTNTFTTSDVYSFTRELERLHPDNRYVRDKIRQQFQVLRDAGLLIHVGGGEWRLP